jgi:hypothetical protein
MIYIENLTVNDKTLTLDYRVSNPFGYDIWICEDIDTYSGYDVETRINGGAIQIKLRLYLECNIMLEVGPLAKYRRLLPGESHSGKILLSLPIRNASPVYYFGERGKKRENVVLKRAVFEVGYFDGRLITRLSRALEKVKRGMSREEIERTRFQPCIEEEIDNGQSREFLYCMSLWPVISKEESAKVVITDVEVPCSTVIENR